MDIISLIQLELKQDILLTTSFSLCFMKNVHYVVLKKMNKLNVNKVFIMNHIEADLSTMAHKLFSRSVNMSTQMKFSFCHDTKIVVVFLSSVVQRVNLDFYQYVSFFLLKIGFLAI